jgi:ferredoxin-NADP reductase
MSLPRKIRCAVDSIVDHGDRVYTVDLVPASRAPLFRAGQFLHLTVDEYDPAGFWPESRVFSIASSPRDRSRIRICYSVTGRYTRKMERALEVGVQVWVKLPYGDFVVGDSGDAVLIAGGTGISAFTAFLEALTPEDPRSVTLVYGARTPALHLFRDMILSQAARVPRFHVLFFSETGRPALAEPLPGLAAAPPCFTGRIALKVVWPRLADPASQVFHLSGPPGMLKALGADLLARGIAPERIRTDAWE